MRRLPRLVSLPALPRLHAAPAIRFFALDIVCPSHVAVDPFGPHAHARAPPAPLSMAGVASAARAGVLPLPSAYAPPGLLPEWPHTHSHGYSAQPYSPHHAPPYGPCPGLGHNSRQRHGAGANAATPPHHLHHTQHAAQQQHHYQQQRHATMRGVSHAAPLLVAPPLLQLRHGAAGGRLVPSATTQLDVAAGHVELHIVLDPPLQLPLPALASTANPSPAAAAAHAGGGRGVQRTAGMSAGGAGGGGGGAAGGPGPGTLKHVLQWQYDMPPRKFFCELRCNVCHAPIFSKPAGLPWQPRYRSLAVAPALVVPLPSQGPAGCS